MNAAQREALKATLRAIAISPDEQARIMRAAADDEPGKAAESYITTRAACAPDALDCTPRTLFRYERMGRLHAVRRSRRCVRWRLSEIEALMHGGPGHD